MAFPVEAVIALTTAIAVGIWAICLMLIAIWRAIGRIEKNYVTHEVCEKRRERCQNNKS